MFPSSNEMPRGRQSRSLSSVCPRSRRSRRSSFPRTVHLAIWRDGWAVPGLLVPIKCPLCQGIPDSPHSYGAGKMRGHPLRCRCRRLCTDSAGADWSMHLFWLCSAGVASSGQDAEGCSQGDWREGRSDYGIESSEVNEERRAQQPGYACCCSVRRLVRLPVRPFSQGESGLKQI